MEKNIETNREKNLDVELGNMFQRLDGKDMEEVLKLMGQLFHKQEEQQKQSG